MAAIQPGRVLVVDDDSRLTFVVSAHLRRAGFEVRTAANGRDGLAIAREYLPDVIVLDWSMPVMDGMEAIQQLKADPLTARIPIIMLTGNPDTESLVLGLESGAQEYVVKPFAMEELIARVRSMHRLSVTGRELDTLTTQLADENNQKTSRLQLLYTFAKELNDASSLDDVLDLIIRCAQQATNSNRVSLMLRDEDETHLVCRRAIGIPAELVSRIRIASVEGIAGKVYSTGKIVTAEAMGNGLVADDRGYASDAFVCAPLILNSPKRGREVLGVLNITDKQGGTRFTSDEVDCIQSIADSAAIAIHTHITRARLERSVRVLLMTVGRLAEYRDEETAQHLERVQDYVRLLAEQMARTPKYRSVLTPEVIENLALAAPLHDIGKVGIPDGILTKEGPLSEREFQIMKTHAIIGRQTLAIALEQTGHIPLLQMSIDIAYCHHEKYDGSGYPRGLKGEDIPLAARIVALADAYDAATSTRRYKAAVPHQQAVESLCADSGQHFDPDVIAAFRRCTAEFERIRRQKTPDLTPSVDVCLVTS